VSSKADDFDVRYRDAGPAGHGRPPADGGFRGNAGEIDYDLGYDAPGWDTQGFRRPEADLPDSHGGRDGHGSPDGTGRDSGLTRGGVGTAVRPEPLGGGRDGSPPGAEETSRLNWESEATGLWVPETPVRGRRGAHGSPSGLGGARGGRPPRSQQGPRGLRGLTGPDRRGADHTRVKFKGSWWRHWTLRKAVGALLAVVGGIVVLGAIAVVMAYEQTPVPTAAMAATGYSQSVVYSKSGALVGRFGTTNRKMLTREQIPQTMINAVLAAEDRNFYNEGGVSPTGIVRAAYSDVRGGDGSLQGGSTITQEFVRQYYSGIGTQQTLTRKIKEIFVAMKVAKEKSKDWILTNYLNTIYLGQGAYGIEAAAQTYYGRHVSQLSTAQAAVIAAIIQQPSNYPLPQYRAQLENRWRYVLNGMVQMGTLTAQQATTMKFPVPGSYVPQTVGSDVWDPYVLNMVWNELTDIYHLSTSQIYNGGYVIRTSVDDKKMAALYAAVRANLATINASGNPFHPTYMHVGAVLEDPATGAIQALYPGPGYPGTKYNGTGKRITASYCQKIHCEQNMAVYAREQVGSSFKPYILSAAVKQGMNVQTSTLNGYNNLCIPPDNLPSTYPDPAIQTATEPRCEKPGYFPVPNDSAAENGPYTPQLAMAMSINTAYTDLWHTVDGDGGMNVVNLVQEFGVNTDRAGITAGPTMKDQAGLALGQASLTVGEQATMLATLANGGVYHNAHVITSITRNNAPPTPIKITSYPVFSSDPTQNTNMASQVQYAMSKDDASYGTAPVTAMSNGQEIIGKTGTTNSAQSAFFIGAIPNQALAVAMFTNQQGHGRQTLHNLGGNSQGGFGGTWPATIWHTYAEDMFVPLGVQPFPTPVFTGQTWNQVPPGLRQVPKKHKKHDPNGNGDRNGRGGRGGGPGGPGGFPTPWPTFSCDPAAVTCQTAVTGTGGNGGPGANGTPR
jgi:membrane peptidoglycan carboxypeptidase